ncbi:MAG: hypothetical protein ABGY96_27510 [bacterium]|nr:hypothetical protein [Gammaproteobacteria bacterium]HIL98039.1 hypothetical protein [Pseudomonadales bacterium]
MNSSTTFPSMEWFAALAQTMGEDRSSFEPLGSIDCTMVVQLLDSPELFEVRFRSYGVESIRHLKSIDDADAEHFTITATAEIWREMIENIISNGKPDLEHTLNYLTFPDDPMVVDGPDQLQIDTFFRYNQSLQLFFNGAARVA